MVKHDDIIDIIMTRAGLRAVRTYLQASQKSKYVLVPMYRGNAVIIFSFNIQGSV